MGTAVFAIAPAQITVETPATALMIAVVRVFQRRSMERRKFAFNRIQPGCVGR